MLSFIISGTMIDHYIYKEILYLFICQNGRTSVVSESYMTEKQYICKF